jgi:PAS domain S-box-containing protein
LSRPNFDDLQDVRQLQNLSTPVWIFDVDRNSLWWANDQGLAFWKSATVSDLRKRDFSTDSASVQKRLRQIVDLATDNTKLVDTWTLYPSDEPQTVILSFQSVTIEHQYKAIMIELVRVLNRDADDDTWRLLEAARATSLMVSTFSTDGKLLAQNPASLACYGKDDRADINASDLGNRLESKDVAAHILTTIATNEATTFEANVITSQGPRAHSITARKGRDPVTGNFVVFLSEEDVTERSRLRSLQEIEKIALKTEIATSDSKLRESRERYELAVETASIWDWDVQTDTLIMSPKFINLLGYTDAEFADILASKGFIGFLHPEEIDTYKSIIKQHFRTPERALSFEARFHNKSGDILWFHFQGKCISGAHGKVVRSVGLLTDVSERKKLESNILISQRLEAVGQLTGGIAHDFNNLLTVILGNAELLAELETKHTELTSEIINAVKRGADLTRHLLAFAKQQILIPRAIDLNQLIPEMENTFLRALGDMTTVTFDAPDDLWNAHADQTMLQSAILNLALNARAAMPSGGTLTISCKNKTLEDIADHEKLELDGTDYVEISVQDTGQGMAADTLAKSFEPFFTTKGVGQGSGLGLSMVLGFSRQSHGDVSIKSAINEGTKVSMYLPRSSAASTQIAPDVTQKNMLGSHEHIHILEDNHNVQQVVSKMVTSLGYKVTTSDTVAQALDWVSINASADLYLVDILLPGGKNGVEFVEHLKIIHPDAKVIFMSGYSADRLSLSTGLDSDAAFISKPFKKGPLSANIRSVLGTTP